MFNRLSLYMSNLNGYTCFVYRIVDTVEGIGFVYRKDNLENPIKYVMLVFFIPRNQQKQFSIQGTVSHKPRKLGF